MSPVWNQKDWADSMFPGEGLEIPDADERDRADGVILETETRWGTPEKAFKIDRVQKFEKADQPTNRAYMRARLRRWWAKSL